MDLLFGYDAKRMTHQPRTIFDNSIGKPISLFWDANGNLAQVVDCARESFRLHDWDDENRLRLMLDPKVVAYYGYDGNGERVYKLTGRCNVLSHIGDEINADALLDDAVLYPNPYIVITPQKLYQTLLCRNGTIGNRNWTDDVHLFSPGQRDTIRTMYAIPSKE